ncbi:MAG: hypothetical protein ACSLFN_13350 [Candidatus Limnocylindrales bacterium]
MPGLPERSLDEGDPLREMEKLRDELTGCIGCGCLSLRTCRLINRDDVAAADGAGSYLLVDRDVG